MCLTLPPVLLRVTLEYRYSSNPIFQMRKLRPSKEFKLLAQDHNPSRKQGDRL